MITAQQLADFAAALRPHIAGELRTDAMTRTLYSTDASLYQIMPLAVLIPRTAEDVIAAVNVAAAHDMPVLARAAGTSLAGQAVNAALVIDFSRHLDAILPPGIRVEVRTRRQIRAYPITLRALDLARRTLTAHVDLPLEEESGLVDAALAGNAECFRVREVAPNSATHDKGGIHRILAAVLRAVVQGRCRIDWAKGPLNGSTVVTRARVLEVPGEVRWDEREASNDADQSSVVLPFEAAKGRRSSKGRA